VDVIVAAAVLAAALLHATWHALVKSSGDRVIALAGMNLVSGFAALLLMPFVALPTALAAGVIAVSVLLHGAYKIALAQLYSRSDLGQGYTLARGFTPIIATAFSFLLISELPNVISLAGILVLACGIGALVLEGGTRDIHLRTVMAALAVGTSVAAYSVLDAYGVRLNSDWLSFTVWLVACDSGAFVIYAAATRRSRAFQAWRLQWSRTLVSGVLGIVSFGVFLWALSRAQVGMVTALRETSVLFAAVIAALFLKERMTAIRWLAAGMVGAGIAAMSIAR
jgi:drug/metabolite transporter (DMT)-like permease